MRHDCKEMTAFIGWDDIESDGDGEWWLSLDANCCLIEIVYCPFCGMKLKGSDGILNRGGDDMKAEKKPSNEG